MLWMRICQNLSRRRRRRRLSRRHGKEGRELETYMEARESGGNHKESTCRIQYCDCTAGEKRLCNGMEGTDLELSLLCCAELMDTSRPPAALPFPFPSILAFPASPQQDTEYQSAKLRSLPSPSFPATFTHVKKPREGGGEGADWGREG